MTVPRLAVAQAWEWERIGPVHPVIGPVDVWVEPDAEDELAELTRQALAQPGFYELRRGRISGWFRDLMLGIASSSYECYGFSTARGGQDRSMLAVPTGKHGALITVEDDRLTLEQIRGAKVIRSVVEALPKHPSAAVAERAVPRTEYLARTNDDSYTLDTGNDYTAVDPADELRTLMAERRQASHQLYVAARSNGIRRASVPLTAIDTANHGRILTYLRPGTDDLEIAWGPGSPAYITETLYNTLEALRS
ncbi:ESX secretion-associated protein EspG [Amycolatopsis sp. NPDC049868]|uniref:ESX secretion-associated protein EspG n=1 Tax=Amycolatopsis sp. NPDC049868 TaxID=3363934 RepID=UPI0037A31062